MSDADLRVAGLVPFSTVDWPGHVVATAFCQGCPWNCVYCYNRDIIDMRTPGAVPFSDVMGLLERRRGLLDGLVFSGGEACAQHALVPAAQRVRDAGFLVGLHTSGAFPDRVCALVEAQTLDWVGLDLKALPAACGSVTGVQASGAKAWRTATILAAAHIPTEVRVTVWPAGPRDALEVLREAHHIGKDFTFAIQRARAQGSASDLPTDGPGFTEWVDEVVRRARAESMTVVLR